MNLNYLVLGLVVLIPINVLVVYVLAVYKETVDPIFPYVSDCAIEPPQAAFFTLLLSIKTLIFVFIGLLRYFQTKAVIESEMYCNSLSLSSDDKNRIICWNKVSSILGLLIVISILSIGSFRTNEMYRFHGLSALVAFSCIILLMAVQTWISFQLQPYINSKFVANFRLITGLLSLLSLIVYAVFTIWSYILFKKNFREDRNKWKPEDGGYLQHVIAAGAELALILLICPFLYSYVPEFKRIKIKELIKLEVIPAVDPKDSQ